MTPPKTILTVCESETSTELLAVKHLLSKTGLQCPELLQASAPKLQLAGRLQQPDLFLLLPSENSMALFQSIMCHFSKPVVLVVGKGREVEDCAPFFSRGARGYLCSEDLPYDLANAIGEMLRTGRLGNEYIFRILERLPANAFIASQLRTPIPEKFGSREQDILMLLKMEPGMTNALLAHRMGLAEGTVKKLMQQIFRKLDIHCRSELQSYILTQMA